MSLAATAAGGAEPVRGTERISLLAALLWGGALLIACNSEAAPGQSRLAVVIANSKYTAVGELKNPAQDGTLVARSLKAAGFDVVAFHDLNDQQFRTALREIVKNSASHDVTLVYYAGHGVQINGINYLVPVDMTAPEQEDDIRLAAISADDVLSVIKSPYKVIVLDACRDNPILGRALTRGRGVSYRRGLAAVAPPTDSEGGVFVAYSTQADAVASDGDGAYSPFAESFARYVGSESSIDDMFALVTHDVLQKTRGAQRPFKYASMDRVLCLTGVCAGAVGAGPATQVAAASASTGASPEARPSAADAFARLQSATDKRQREALEQALWEQLLHVLPPRVVYGISTSNEGVTYAYAFETSTAKSDGHNATVTVRTGQLKDGALSIDEGASSDEAISCDTNEMGRVRYQTAREVVFLSQAERQAQRHKVVEDTVGQSLETALCKAPLRLTPLWGLDGIEWTDIGRGAKAARAVQYRDPEVKDVRYIFVRFERTKPSSLGADVEYLWYGLNCATKEYLGHNAYFGRKTGEISEVFGTQAKWETIVAKTPASNAYVIVCEQP